MLVTPMEYGHHRHPVGRLPVPTVSGGDVDQPAIEFRTASGTSDHVAAGRSLGGILTATQNLWDAAVAGAVGRVSRCGG